MPRPHSPLHPDQSQELASALRAPFADLALLYVVPVCCMLAGPARPPDGTACPARPFHKRQTLGVRESLVFSF